MLRRSPPARFEVSFDQAAILAALDLGLWALLDFLHAEPHAPLALEGLFGWACYLLLALSACTLITPSSAPSDTALSHTMARE